MLRIASRLERQQESDDESDDGQVDEMINLSRQSGGADQPLFPSAVSGSSVLGPSYATGGATMATFRESQIKEAEGVMSSNDKKRLVRLLMESNFFCEDLGYCLRFSLPMRSLEELTAMVEAKGMSTASSIFEDSQEKVKEALDNLTAKLKHELGLVYLANDKSNSHGFAAVDKMKSMATLEHVTTKETRDLWTKACSSLDKTRSTRKRKGHGNRDANKKRKRGGGAGGGGGGRPALPKCAACGKLGHVAGDARCNAAPKP